MLLLPPLAKKAAGPPRATQSIQVKMYTSSYHGGGQFRGPPRDAVRSCLLLPANLSEELERVHRWGSPESRQLWRQVCFIHVTVRTSYLPRMRVHDEAIHPPTDRQAGRPPCTSHEAQGSSSGLFKTSEGCCALDEAGLLRRDRESVGSRRGWNPILTARLFSLPWTKQATPYIRAASQASRPVGDDGSIRSPRPR